MRHTRRETFRRLFSVPGYSVVFVASTFFVPSADAGPLILHPKAEPLPTEQQGPFVTMADGGILCIDATHAHRSRDEGKTWESTPLFPGSDQFRVSNERALLKTRRGTIISAWMNLNERNFTPGFKWGGPPEEFSQWILPTYVSRSLDDGKTWEEPQLLQRPWCGCIHSLIETNNGRLVLVGQTIIPEWRHATVMYVSDDDGATWQASNILDYGVGRHDHAGSCEATILERRDGSLYELIRTESGYFFEADSRDGGLTWENLQKSSVPSVTCCGQMARLSDGRAALLWNHPPRYQPNHPASREELSIAFSDDDGRTWTDRTVIAARYLKTGDKGDERRVSYPYLYERNPGELWITTMQGGLRMRVKTADISVGEVAPPPTVVFLGDSTTAYRPGEVSKVVSERVDAELLKTGSSLRIANRGVGGSTTTAGLDRLKAEIADLNAKVVVIQFGINDSAADVWRTPPETTPRVSREKFVANLRDMIEQVRANGGRPILMTANPLRWIDKTRELYGKPPYDPNAEDGFDKPFLQSYNAAVRELAAETNVPLLDVHHLFLSAAKAEGKPVDDWLLDGTHPNDRGHELIANALVPLLRETIKSPANRKQQ
ncbi:MAG: exo-alpha-sialidase [Planctomycetaceae bacterium]|nr:exo-alpha-sialidase [Planctomycetaceae bacterium]